MLEIVIGQASGNRVTTQMFIHKLLGSFFYVALALPVCLPILGTATGAGPLPQDNSTLMSAKNLSPKQAQRQCLSSDTNERLLGCTIVINARGFGSKGDLSAALDGRCWAFNNLQQYERGLADCEASIALNPRYSYAYNNLGTSLFGLGEIQRAIVAFTKAIELKPNFVYSRLNRARAYVASGNPGLAQKDLEFAVAIDPTNQEAKQAIAALNNPPSTPPTTSDSTTTEPEAKPNYNRMRYGTGFFVTAKGHVLTNFHVVKDCKNITISSVSMDVENTIARVTGSDPTNDLAVLTTRLTPSVVPAFNSHVRTGDSIFVYGFPLAGLLASSGNFTAGSITATAGLGDNTSFFQISAPVQPGNSGGPLIDEFGNVAGVITSKLNVLAVANITNDVAQNINFAIKPSVATSFLESYGLSPGYDIGKQRLEPANIAELAKRYTVRVSCQ
jgi:S1-C subfamily serine protease